MNAHEEKVQKAMIQLLAGNDRFYKSVPKGWEGNLKFRKEMVEAGSSDLAWKDALIAACTVDPIFYFNTFYYLKEPRDPDLPIPFITYGYQDEMLLELQAYAGSRDIMYPKSRDMGASWIVVGFSEQNVRFLNHRSIMMLSRTESLVDKPDDPDSLFTKMDFLIRYLPPFLDCDMNRTFAHLRNPNKDSVVDGYSSSGNTATGRRRFFLVFDEFGKMENAEKIDSDTIHVSRSRIYVSSASGAGTTWHRVWHDNTNIMAIKRELRWQLHPEHVKGKYLDPKTGKESSPWRDYEISRSVQCENIIKQDIDLEWVTSAARFFDETLVENVMKKHVRPPDMHFEYDSLRNTFKPDPFGGLLVWTNPKFPWGKDGKPPYSRYAIGIDNSGGVGESNSVASVICTESGEYVAQYAHARLNPLVFARLCVALARWFYNAYCIWERQYVGSAFGEEVMRLKYRNVHWHGQEDSITKKPSDTPGWQNSPTNKAMILHAYNRAIAQELAINHSEMSALEMRLFIDDPETNTINQEGTVNELITDAKRNNGDRVMADAMAWKAMSERPFVYQEPVLDHVVKQNTFEWRRNEHLKRERAKKSW